MIRGFGLLGVLLVLLSSQAPIGINLIVGMIGLACATIGALGGDRMFAVASVGVFITSLVLLSPLTLSALITGSFVIEYLTDLPGLVWLFGVIVFTLLPIAAMILNGAGRLVIGNTTPAIGDVASNGKRLEPN